MMSVLDFIYIHIQITITIRNNVQTTLTLSEHSDDHTYKQKHYMSYYMLWFTWILVQVKLRLGVKCYASNPCIISIQ